MVTRVKGMTLVMLSCPTCGNAYDAKRLSEIKKQIASIVNAKSKESVN